MLRTAGLCTTNEIHQPKRQHCAKISISLKVCDPADRIRDTLIHEICHAASWLLDDIRDSHGISWQYYAQKCNSVHPELPKVTRCHNYTIHYKIYYECMLCKYSISLNLSWPDSAVAWGSSEPTENCFEHKAEELELLLRGHDWFVIVLWCILSPQDWPLHQIVEHWTLHLCQMQRASGLAAIVLEGWNPHCALCETICQICAGNYRAVLNWTAGISHGNVMKRLSKDYFASKQKANP